MKLFASTALRSYHNGFWTKLMNFHILARAASQPIMQLLLRLESIILLGIPENRVLYGADSLLERISFVPQLSVVGVTPGGPPH
jgi:hypothetical protein